MSSEMSSPFSLHIPDSEQVHPHTLCHSCREICTESKYLRNVPKVDEDMWTRGKSVETGEESFIFNKSLREMRDSHASGCHLCSLAWSAIIESKSGAFDMEDTKEIALNIKRENGICTMDFRIGGESQGKLTAYALEGTYV